MTVEAFGTAEDPAGGPTGPRPVVRSLLSLEDDDAATAELPTATG